MSWHTLQSKLETSCAAYLTATVDGIGTVRKTEDSDQQIEPSACYVLCSSASSRAEMTANYSAQLTVELRTNLNLKTGRAAAVTAHNALWGLIADAMMDDGLLTALDATYGTDLSIQGIHNENSIGYLKRDDDTLVSSITRTIEACPQ